MTQRHLLITSTYYWPESTGNAPYVTGLAEHMAAAGYRVTVATGFPHYPAWRSTSGPRLGASERHVGVEIRRRWHYVPRRPTALRRSVYEASIAAVGWTALAPLPRPDAVVSVVPTLASGLVGWAAARAYRAPFGLIFQDLVGQAAKQNGMAGAGRLGALLGRLELKMARGAGRIGVITSGFRGELESGGVDPGRVSLLRNWAHTVPPADGRDATRARLGWRDNEFICLHSGNMGQKQELDNLLAAAHVLEREGCGRIRIVLAGDGNDRPRLELEAARRGLQNTTFLGLQPAGRYEAMLAAADLLVVHQRASLTNAALPSKLTSYFSAGRPVLAVAAAGSETAAEVHRSRGGIIIDPGQPELLACQIRALAADPALRCLLGEQGHRYAQQRLSREAALVDYEQFVSGLLEDAA